VSSVPSRNESAHDRHATQAHGDGCRHPGRERYLLAHHWPGRPDPAPGPLPDANFNRERIPERQPHTKGHAAFGYFEVTNDVRAFTRAAVFQPGAKTDTLIRFSTVAGERGSPDTWRDPRGFALKFYTSEGNLDIVGNNTPVFFVRDPMKFQHFIRSQKRRVDTGLRDHDMQWDFWTLVPESAHQVTWLMGDRGIPRTWRHTNGYGSHTYSWINAAGRSSGSSTTSSPTRASTASPRPKQTRSPAGTRTTTSAIWSTLFGAASTRAGR
jgi:hypothetical protein